MRRILLIMAAAALLGLPAARAQEADRTATLADIRQELTALNGTLVKLKRELEVTGGIGAGLPMEGSVLERIDAIEAEVRQITGKIESLEFRIKKIVEDGTNRIGDLEFRLVELEGGDTSALQTTSTLGGEAGGDIQTAIPARQGGLGDSELAIGETADFESAKLIFESGQHPAAIAALGRFLGNYPGSPYTTDAQMLLGESHAQSNDWRSAARAFLEAFSGNPEGSHAPRALFRLGSSLERIGQHEEACLTLNEVTVRYPSSEAAPLAREEMDSTGCG